ncbi:hypothetical protein CNMCM7691_004107 [Aspergillus felis]|uniref:Synaptobrevin homolog YKT6 n=1 Tax=Aspergillus felis TaxID=1287682 RepID=A0A8H6R4S9_9EURO|nr:hypothetical protein CNMCM7691_004107 [Aspergillus felis]
MDASTDATQFGYPYLYLEQQDTGAEGRNGASQFICELYVTPQRRDKLCRSKVLPFHGNNSIAMSYAKEIPRTCYKLDDPLEHVVGLRRNTLRLLWRVGREQTGMRFDTNMGSYACTPPSSSSRSSGSGPIKINDPVVNLDSHITLYVEETIVRSFRQAVAEQHPFSDPTFSPHLIWTTIPSSQLPQSVKMKIVYIGILQNAQQPAVELCAERELSSYSRFTRGSISEFMTMFSKTVAERTKQGQRQDIQEQDFTFHVYARTQGIAGVIISDNEYPSLAAHQILSKILDEFLAQNPSAATSRNPVPFPQLRTYITTYQNPQEVDSIMKIQKELDETKIVLHKTIESVLERGEKIDDLVSKSEGLSAQSKMFYTSAKKQNSCCVIM